MDEKRHRLSGKPVTAEAVLRCVNIIIFSVHEQFGGKRESRLFLLIVRRVIFNLNIYTFKSFSENCLIFF